MKQLLSKGFTLIEVLVALIILAIALLSIIVAMQTSVRSVSHLKNKISAHWVAMNVLANMQSQQLQAPTDSNTPSGDGKMLDTEWHWEAVQSGASNKFYEQIKISVTPKGKNNTVDTLTGFVRIYKK